MSCFYIAFPNQASFDAWHADVNAALLLPNPSIHTVNYTYAIPGNDGLLYVPVEETCPASELEEMDLIPAEQVELDAEGSRVVKISGVVLG